MTIMIMKGTLMHCCHLIFTPYSNFTNCFNNIVLAKRSSSKPCITLGCHVSNATVQFLVSPRLPWPWPLKITGQLFFRVPTNWICLIFSHVTHLGQECYRNVFVFFSVHLIKCCMIAMSPINDNANLDHLIKMASARLIHYEVTPLPLCN